MTAEAASAALDSGAEIPADLARECREVLESASREPALASPDGLRAGPFFAFEPSDGSLAGGYAGLAVLHHHLAALFPAAGHGRSAALFLDAAIEAAAATEAPALSLLDGVTGVGWAADYLSRGKPLDEADPNEAIDEALEEALQTAPWPGSHDLASGLVGLGVYALARGRRGRSSRILRLVVARLEELARPDSGGLAWLTGPESLDELSRGERTSPHFDVGLAHGTAGAVALLAFAREAQQDGGSGARLVEGGVAWLLSQRLGAGEDSRYPRYRLPGAPPRPSRLAWCQGDLGVALALLHASRALGRADWREEAVIALLAAVRRTPESSGAVDGGLCHGALGLALLFDRLARETNEPAARRAAAAWLRRGLAMRLDGAPRWAFRTQYGLASGERRMVLRPGLLNGVAGALLGLASILGAPSPWEELLLLSPPGEGGGWPARIIPPTGPDRGAEDARGRTLLSGA